MYSRCYKKVTVKKLKEFIFEKYYRQTEFTKKTQLLFNEQ